MSMNKIIHIYRYGEKLCNIAKNYNTTPHKILEDSNITSIEMLTDFTPLVINLDTKCNEEHQIYCNEEKRGCYGCYYNKI